MHHLRIFLFLIFLPAFLVLSALSCDDRNTGNAPTLTSPIINLNNKKISNLAQLNTEIPNGSTRSNAQWLLLNNNRLTVINNGELDDFVNLSWLSVQNNRITNIADNSLAQLRRLERIYLRRNRLTVIEPSVFPSDVNLNLIDLAENRFAAIPLNLIRADFASGIGLGTNFITTIPANFLADNGKLTTIVLSANQITTVPTDAFANDANLREVFLSDNAIATVDDNAFSGTRLHRIDLSTNRLTSVPGQAVPIDNRVQNLSLRSNSISAIGADDFDRFAEKLQVLSMDGNPLDPAQVDDNAFTKLTNLLLFFVEYRKAGDVTRLPQDDPALTNLRLSNKRLIIRDMR